MRPSDPRLCLRLWGDRGANFAEQYRTDARFLRPSPACTQGPRPPEATAAAPVNAFHLVSEMWHLIARRSVQTGMNGGTHHVGPARRGCAGHEPRNLRDAHKYKPVRTGQRAFCARGVYIAIRARSNPTHDWISASSVAPCPGRTPPPPGGRQRGDWSAMCFRPLESRSSAEQLQPGPRWTIIARLSGAMAQLGARLHGMQKVRGSSPLGSSDVSNGGPTYPTPGCTTPENVPSSDAREHPCPSCSPER